MLTSTTLPRAPPAAPVLLSKTLPPDFRHTPRNFQDAPAAVDDHDARTSCIPPSPSLFSSPPMSDDVKTKAAEVGNSLEDSASLVQLIFPWRTDTALPPRHQHQLLPLVRLLRRHSRCCSSVGSSSVSCSAYLTSSVCSSSSSDSSADGAGIFGGRPRLAGCVFLAALPFLLPFGAAAAAPSSSSLPWPCPPLVPSSSSLPRPRPSLAPSSSSLAAFLEWKPCLSASLEDARGLSSAQH